MRKPLEVVSSALGAAAKGSRLRNSNSGNAVLPDAARTQHHELSSNNLSMKRFQDLNITQNGDRRDIEQLSGQRIARSVSGLSESSCLASAVTKMTKCSYMDTGSSPPPMNRRQTVDDAMAASNGQATSMVLAAGPPSARLPGQNATEPQTTPQEDATDTATFPFRLSALATLFVPCTLTGYLQVSPRRRNHPNPKTLTNAKALPAAEKCNSRPTTPHSRDTPASQSDLYSSYS
ncbi:hypothetical protein FA15DRAFT_515745 [Coprinopsis marcescibilis]|uniref:Uncharacterized protein n=1 Tax=Coprinopsis marcescibilis TaxID=230819 RepID=A0A5C3L2Z0_COPMA|nr:hypothetical protein FA15DRAFT_515745 [Coprinopsis marcescibilis]